MRPTHYQSFSFPSQFVGILNRWETSSIFLPRIQWTHRFPRRPCSTQEFRSEPRRFRPAPIDSTEARLDPRRLTERRSVGGSTHLIPSVINIKMTDSIPGDDLRLPPSPSAADLIHVSTSPLSLRAEGVRPIASLPSVRSQSTKRVTVQVNREWTRMDANLGCGGNSLSFIRVHSRSNHLSSYPNALPNMTFRTLNRKEV